MIVLTRLNKEELVVNADMIEAIEATPDSLICLTTGRKIPVRDSIEEIVKKVIKYKQLTNQTIAVTSKENRSNPGN